jgi:hypothetical protein
MKRAISTILSGIVLSTLIGTSATLALTPKAQAAESKSAQSTNFDPEKAYIEKYGC